MTSLGDWRCFLLVKSALEMSPEGGAAMEGNDRVVSRVLGGFVGPESGIGP